MPKGFTHMRCHSMQYLVVKNVPATVYVKCNRAAACLATDRLILNSLSSILVPRESKFPKGFSSSYIDLIKVATCLLESRFG